MDERIEENPELAAARYRELVNQLGAELGRKRGWKARVARKLGVHPSYISKVVAGGAAASGGEVIDRATARIGLRRAFFYDPSADISDYREYLLSPDERAGLAGLSARLLRPRSMDWSRITDLANKVVHSPEPTTEDAGALASAVLSLPVVQHALRCLAEPAAPIAKQLAVEASVTASMVLAGLVSIETDEALHERVDAQAAGKSNPGT